METTNQFDHTATYSPEDNKLRLYPAYRLGKEEYDQVKSAGFGWAPKQECFFATWSPKREAVCIQFAGEVEDEDKSLVQRAEERAERFEDYSDKRTRDAERASAAVHAIADNIPLGQPILVGHHSEKRARKDAERIDNGMRRAVKMWDTAAYWKERAAGAIAHAKYKELPTVRARRIKTIRADLDKVIREFTPYAKAGTVMQEPWNCPVCGTCFCKEHPEAKVAIKHVWTGNPGRGGSWTPEADLPKIEAWAQPWIKHYNMRLDYETAMLEAEGKAHLIDKPKRPEQLPLLNYRQESFMIENRYHKGQFYEIKQIEMTKAEFAKIYSDYRGTRNLLGHRIRVAIAYSNGTRTENAVFLADSKEHPVPQLEDMAPLGDPEPIKQEPRPFIPREPQEPTEADKMREALKAGVQIVTSQSLFPTPPELAEQMIEAAQIQPGMSILEPSAGTASLIKAMPNIRPYGSVTAVDISEQLCKALEPWADRVICADFLSLNGELGKFDRVVMNPPFENCADIRHIQRAYSYLAPGGRLVAICANGPRQQAALIPWVNDRGGTFEPLPHGSFKASGANVNTAIIVMDAVPA